MSPDLCFDKLQRLMITHLSWVMTLPEFACYSLFILCHPGVAHRLRCISLLLPWFSELPHFCFSVTGIRTLAFSRFCISYRSILFFLAFFCRGSLFLIGSWLLFPLVSAFPPGLSKFPDYSFLRSKLLWWNTLSAPCHSDLISLGLLFSFCPKTIADFWLFRITSSFVVNYFGKDLLPCLVFLITVSFYPVFA